MTDRETRDGAEMPFLDHLEELRWRIIWALAAVVVSIAIGFFLVLRYDVVARLEAPILPYLNGHHVIATHPTDGLQFTVSAAMWIGAVLSFPVVRVIWRYRPTDGGSAALLLAPLLMLRGRRFARA